MSARLSAILGLSPSDWLRERRRLIFHFSVIHCAGLCDSSVRALCTQNACQQTGLSGEGNLGVGDLQLPAR